MIKVQLGKRRYAFTDKAGVRQTRWTWQARWRGPDGRDMARSLGTQDAHRARNLAVEMEALLNQGVAPAQHGPRPLHWEAAWDEYFLLHQTVKRPATLETDGYAWRAFWGWARGEGVTRLDGATPALVARFRDWCVDPAGGGRRARTTNDLLSRCGTIYNKLIRKRIIPPLNPFDGVERLASDTAVKTWLTPAEAAALLAAAAHQGRDHHLFVALGLYAGLRPVESLSLRWDWITWPTGPNETGWITVPARDGDFEVKNKRARHIPLAPALRALLAFHRGAPRGFAVAPFETGGAGRYRWNPRKGFAALAKRAGIARAITPYTLRHTFASNALAAGISHYEVMDWMGHRDIRTLQIYGHLKPDNPNIARLYGAKEAEA